MVQLFAIQSCPILHGPVIVFDPRDVEILKQLGVSSIANENVSTTSNSLVRDLEESKDIRKGEFTITKQLPDFLPKSIHTTMATRILKNRRRVPFELKAVNTYTQAMKYFKSSPAAKETIEGKQFDLKKPLVGLSLPKPVAAKPATIDVQEASGTTDSTDNPNNDKPEKDPQKETEKALAQIDKVNDDKSSETVGSAEETSEKTTTDDTPDINMEPLEVDMETPEMSDINDTDMSDINVNTAIDEKGTLNMEPLEVNMETQEVSGVNDTDMSDINVNTAVDEKDTQDEGEKLDSPPSQQKVDVPPQEDTTSPGTLQGAAELVKLRKRAATKKSPVPTTHDTATPKRRGKAGRPPKNKSPKAAAGAAIPTNAVPPAATAVNAVTATAVGTTTTSKRRARLPTKANATQTTEITSPPSTTTTAGATQLLNPTSVDAPAAGKRSPIKKRGRPPKAKPEAATPSPATAAAVEALMVATRPPATKHGRPAKAKQVAESTTTPAASPAPQGTVEQMVPQAKKRGRSPKTTTTTAAATVASRTSSPPKKRGRAPENQTAAAVEPTPAVTPAPNVAPTIQPPIGTTGATTTNATATTETSTNVAAPTVATDTVVTDAVVLTPPRKPRDSIMGDDVPLTPNYNSDGSGGEPFLTPIIESPVTQPAGPGHFSTRNAGAKWNEKFLELFRYKMQYGNCNVSAKANDNPHKALGEWVRIQRRRKNGKSKSLKQLSGEEEAKLNAVGFDWRSTSKLEWEDRFQQLVKYKMAYGNADVPDDYSENPSLAAWCDTQRENWREKILVEKQQSMMDEGEVMDELKESIVDENGNQKKLSNPMTDEQEGKLLALGFRF